MIRLFIVLFCLPAMAMAQFKPLLVEGAAPNLYVNHTVAAKENYYSVGRLYNISPKEIAPFNNLILEKGLSLNQNIKVPLTVNNFVQDGEAAADEALVPVYHIVKDKEGLMHISSIYNKLPLANIRQWNNLKSDVASAGTKLIVGYLKVKKELSALSGMAKPMPVVVNVPAPPPPKIVVKENTVEIKTPVKEKPVVVAAPPKEKPVAVATPKKEQPAMVKETKITKPVADNHLAKNFNGGIFKNDFDGQVKNTATATQTGTAAIFKSTSGWEDGKYYCLHNTASPGTIIKITSNITGKTVYAKVLDVIPDIKQNDDLLIRLSNAAAKDLGVEETKFDCSLSYSK
jgi:LysM repeat protein